VIGFEPTAANCKPTVKKGLTENSIPVLSTGLDILLQKWPELQQIIAAWPGLPEHIKKAKINKTTLYKWLKEPEFKAELDRQRDEIVSEAFGVLSQGLTKAVTGLLDTKDDRLKRLVCKDIIEHILKRKEIEDLNERLTEIENQLAKGSL
jgi:hypothetical protein